MAQIIRRSIFVSFALLLGIPLIVEAMAAVGINRDRVHSYRVCTLSQHYLDCGFYFIKVQRRDVQFASSNPHVGSRFGCVLTMEQTPITNIPLAVSKRSVRCSLEANSPHVMANPGSPGFVFTY